MPAQAEMKSYGYGILCPNCNGAHHDVTDSRPAVGYLRRRRRCKTCRKNFTTHEVPSRTSGDTFFKACVIAMALEHMPPARARMVHDLIGVLAKETT